MIPWSPAWEVPDTLDGTTPHEIPASRLTEHPAWRLGNLLDIRPAAAFATGHVAGACNVPAPQRPSSLLLPPRHEPLLVVAEDRASAGDLVAWLRSRGRPEVEACVLGAAQLAALPPAAVEAGPGRRWLWRPPAFLAEHAALLPPPARGPLLDLGCGSGRGAVWLAARGYRVLAVDRDPEALARVVRLAAASGIPEDRVERLCADLRRAEAVPAGPWAGAVMIRFVSRPVLARLPDLLLPGGLLVIRALRGGAGAEDASERQHKLALGELPRLLPDPPFELLVDREDHDPDGRAAAGAVARLR